MRLLGFYFAHLLMIWLKRELRMDKLYLIFFNAVYVKLIFKIENDFVCLFYWDDFVCKQCILCVYEIWLDINLANDYDYELSNTH